MFDTNVLALLVGCQAAVRAMRACNAEGQIVNISSVVAQRPNGGVYAATKHAVNTDFCQFAGRVRTGFDSHNKCNAWGDCH